MVIIKIVLLKNDYCIPSTNYGRSKLVIETCICCNRNLSILRLGNVVGLDSIGKMFRNWTEFRYLDCRDDLSTALDICRRSNPL